LYENCQINRIKNDFKIVHRMGKLICTTTPYSEVRTKIYQQNRYIFCISTGYGCQSVKKEFFFKWFYFIYLTERRLACSSPFGIHRLLLFIFCWWILVITSLYMKVQNFVYVYPQSIVYILIQPLLFVSNSFLLKC
jgi:hypothetical protein